MSEGWLELAKSCRRRSEENRKGMAPFVGHLGAELKRLAGEGFTVSVSGRCLSLDRWLDVASPHDIGVLFNDLRHMEVNENDVVLQKMEAAMRGLL